MKQTQRKIVEQRLKDFGEIENVWAIENYILRLGAIICQLRKDGWEIDGDFIQGTKNFRYVVRKAPTKVIRWDLDPIRNVRTPIYG